MDAHYTRGEQRAQHRHQRGDGFAYAVGSSPAGRPAGVASNMIDIREPKEPHLRRVLLRCPTGAPEPATPTTPSVSCNRGPDQRYQGKEICFNAKRDRALHSADVSDKWAPVAVSRAAYPNVAYSHQGWLDEEQRYFYHE